MIIQHDFHIHTNLSVCAKPGATLEMYLQTAKELGLKKIGFSDHLWDDTYEITCPGFYRKQNVAHVLRLKETLHDTEDVKTAFGCEAEYDPRRGNIALSPEHAELFDFVIVPVSHTHMIMPKDLYEPMEKHKDFMLTAWRNVLTGDMAKYVKVMAHPFAAVCCPYGWEPIVGMITDDEYRYAFDLAAEKNVAVEINVSALRRRSEEAIAASPVIRMFRIAKECGCRFTFGSDSHNVGDHEGYLYACGCVADLLQLSEEDIADLARCSDSANVKG